VDFDSIIMELTETVMVEDVDSLRAQLQHIRATGVRIAIDDFGTGAAGLSHLRELPFDEVKIDRSSITAILPERRRPDAGPLGIDPVEAIERADSVGGPVVPGGHNAGQQLVGQIIELARSLGAVSVAEGIETPEQVDWLTRIGCDLGQGYHLARPMPAAEVDRWLARWSAGSTLSNRMTSGLSIVSIGKSDSI
jgi:EAL domain-containing protein (putative c-di-GMP-specific phosphodiesterase class I)